MNKAKLAKVLNKVGGDPSEALFESLSRELDNIRQSIPKIDLEPVFSALGALTSEIQKLSTDKIPETRVKDLEVGMSLYATKIKELENAVESLPYASRADLKELRDRLLTMLANIGGGNANRNIQVNGINVLTPFTDINLKAGSNITLSTAANQTTKYTELTIAVTGGSSFAVLVPIGAVDGSNTTFTFASAPSIVVLDNGNIMNKVSSDGTVNWTGTTTVILTQAPNSNIFGY